MVSASWDGTLKLWDVEASRELITLRGHEDAVNSCVITADGLRIASASSDGRLKVWEMETGRELATFQHQGPLKACAITATGHRVVSACWDGTLKVWDVERKRELATLQGHEDSVNGCAMTADGRYVVSASSDGTLKVWDAETTQCLHKLHGSSSFISVACSSDVICAGDARGAVWMLKLNTSTLRANLHHPYTVTPSLDSTMSVRLPLPLFDAYRANTLALFIGSGLSLGHGVKGKFPTWNQLLHRLLDACDQFGALDTSGIQAKRIFFKSRLRLEVMLSELGSLRTALDRDYQKALNGIFRPADAAPGEAHAAVARLGIRAILTTNYDPLLEEIKETPRRQPYTWKESDLALSDLESERKVLFKIHGTAERHDTVVMNELEYHQVRTDRSYQKVLSYLFQHYTFLFIGYGMNDPIDLDLVLKWNAEAFKSATRRHYALLKDPNSTDCDRYEREYNVRVIQYSDHAQLPAILDELRRAAPGQTP